MKYGKFYSRDLNADVIQINKIKAEHLYSEGKTIYLQACNMIFNNVWQSACPINKSEAGYGETFHTVVNGYKYYNCDNVRGKYPCFFVVEKQY